MESSMNNAFIMSKHATTTTFPGDQTPEESSWTMYFEDFFEASSSIVDVVGDCSSSSISDAASFVATKKTLHVSKQEGFNYSMDVKRTRNREIPFGRHHDLEDTASSPSHSPNVYSMVNLLDNNTRHSGCIVGDDTINEKREIAVQNHGELLSADLKKKGLCLVPLSMVANYLG